MTSQFLYKTICMDSVTYTFSFSEPIFVNGSFGYSSTFCLIIDPSGEDFQLAVLKT